MARIDMHQFAESWERLFEAALSEWDCDKLPQRIADAEIAIMSCAEHLDARRDNSKLNRLLDALITLRDLRTMGHT